jgi:protein O-mannosyl-transferase
MALSPRGWWTALALVAATIAIYLPAVNHDFVYYDDPKYVTENAVVSAGFTRAGLAWAFTTSTDANWFPVTWLSHMLDVQLYGMDAGGHHLTSLLLHALSTALLFTALHRMTGRMGRSAFVAALFALHPLHVESVAWVAERKDVLSTVFWMLTLLAYVAYARDPKLRRFIIVAVLLGLGLMSKPMLVTLPFVLLLLDFWPLRRLEKRSYGQLVAEKIPLLAIVVASSITTFLVQRKGGAVGSLDAYPFALRVGNALMSYVAYIGKMIWPSDLTAFYPYRMDVSIPAALVALVVLVGLSIVSVRLRKKYPYLPVGWFWYVGTLVPVIGLVQVGNQAMADRYSYIPLIGLFVIVAWGAGDLADRWRIHRYALPAAAAIAIVAAAFISRSQLRHWQSTAQLWTHALDATRDNYVAHNNLGLALAGDGKVEDAISHYREALRIRPMYATARTNLGAALAKQGKFDEAIANYQEVLRSKPGMSEAHMDLGAALASQGKIDEAIGHYRDAVRLKPDFAEAYANLGLAFASQGQLDSAIAEYQKAIQVKPSFAEAHNNLGFALARQGKLAESVDHYTEAIRYKPDFVLAHVNLGVSLANMNRVNEAIRAFREVLRLEPGNEMAARAVSQLSSQGPQ